MNQTESGFIEPLDTDCIIGSSIGEIEVIRVTKTNVIARGRRYGRLWFLKGLREELRDSAVMQRQIQKEFEIHSRLRHPGVPHVVGLENVAGLGFCIVEEWIEGAPLHSALEKGRLSSSEKRRVMRDVIETAAYLHSRGIVHRDLKPANVMIRDVGGETVLIDYGLADTADYVEIKAPAGTPGFISPEQEENGGASPGDDVYSLGVMMRELSPRHKRIADRCTGSVKSRPKDAGELLKLIDSRARRARIAKWVVAALIIAAVAVFGINRIRSLENSSLVASERISRLSDENAGNIALVSSLEDSLVKVNNNLQQAREELDRRSEYENLKQSAIRNGNRMLDDILLKQDKIISTEDPDIIREQFNDIVYKMTQTYQKIQEYCDSLKKSGLTQEDIEVISSTLHLYFAKEYSEYQKKWLKIIYPEHTIIQ